MGELSFVVITTYDSEEIATAAQQRIAEIWQDATKSPMQIESSMQGGVFASSYGDEQIFTGDLICKDRDRGLGCSN